MIADGELSSSGDAFQSMLVGDGALSASDPVPSDLAVLEPQHVTASVVAPDRPAARPGPAARPVRKPRGYLRLRVLLVGLDILAGLVSWTAAFVVGGHGHWLVRVGRAGALASVLTVVLIVLLAASKLYLARVCSIRTVETSRIGQVSVLVGLTAALMNREYEVAASDVVPVMGAAAMMILLLVLRRGYSAWLRSCRARGLFCRPVCILGVNDEAASIVHLLEGQPDLGYRVVAVLGDPQLWDAEEASARVVEPGDDAARTARDLGASGVVIAVSALGPLELDPVVRQVIAAGLHVQMSSGLTRIGYQRMRAAPLSHQLLFYVEHPGLRRWQSVLKRSIDVAATAIGLVVLSPILGAAAFAVWVGDRGPALYRQERIGRDGRTFRVIKLRTMQQDASQKLASLAALNERKGPLFKLRDDPRVTPVGRFLRATNLDELPQLFNVLRGDMSLVGPRPALPAEAAQFDRELLDRVSVRPGITGLWQVEAGDSPSFHAYRRLDLFYVDNWSVAMDLTIILATVGLVLRRAARFASGSGGEIRTVNLTDH